MSVKAKVIKDSVSVNGHRVTTIEVQMHRFVLAELNTHRMFSRNSASSRAIPINKQIQKIENDLAYPVYYGSKKAGMQAGPEVSQFKKKLAEREWRKASKRAIRSAKRMDKLGIHKQVANRLLEPFMWHTVVITSTEWCNFFSQRTGADAQPEMRAAACAIEKAFESSSPVLLDYTQWHLPYITEYDQIELNKNPNLLAKVSAARCARVSYLSHDGQRDLSKDIDLYNKLTTASPPHASPLEHVCYPSETPDNVRGNLTGWHQLRHNIHLVDDSF